MRMRLTFDAPLAARTWKIRYLAPLCIETVLLDTLSVFEAFGEATNSVDQIHELLLLQVTYDER